MTEKTIFDYLNNLYFKQELVYDKKIAPAYLLSLWLSHDKGLIDMVNVINEFQFFISDDLIYKYYYYNIPQGKRYLKWVKKEEVDKKAKENFEAIRKDMMLSKKEMEKYKNFNFTNIAKNVNVKKKNENASKIFL